MPLTHHCVAKNWQGFIYPNDNTVKVWKHIFRAFQQIQRVYSQTFLSIELWSGAISDHLDTDTPFPWRGALYSVDISIRVNPNETNALQIFNTASESLNRIWNQVIAIHLKGNFANYIQPSLSDRNDWAEVIWGDNIDRLQQVKQKYDPHTTFHQPQSVPPLNTDDDDTTEEWYRRG